MGLSTFDTAAVAVGFVLALLATQWWAWLGFSLLGAGAALLYAIAAATQFQFILALEFLVGAVAAYAQGQAMMFWLQPERRARARAGEGVPRVIWRQGITFGAVLLLGLVLALWPTRWWLPKPLATARVRLGDVGPAAPRPMPAVPSPDIDWNKLSDGTRYAMAQGINRPDLCPTDRGEAFLADCQRYATNMANVAPTDIQSDVPRAHPLPAPDAYPAGQPAVGAGTTPDPTGAGTRPPTS